MSKVQEYIDSVGRKKAHRQAVNIIRELEVVNAILADDLRKAKAVSAPTTTIRLVELFSQAEENYILQSFNVRFQALSFADQEAEASYFNGLRHGMRLTFADLAEKAQGITNPNYAPKTLSELSNPQGDPK